MIRKNKRQTIKNDTEIWTEEQYEQYMKGLYGLDFIAGYTEGGVPYGNPFDVDNEVIGLSGESSYDHDGEDLPFSYPDAQRS